jgi:hypothetical protein
MDSEVENSKLNARLWRILHEEFLKNFNEDSTYDAWISFIENKDLGLAVSVNEYYLIYKIIDERKWLLAKLKYGL